MGWERTSALCCHALKGETDPSPYRSRPSGQRKTSGQDAARHQNRVAGQLSDIFKTPAKLKPLEGASGPPPVG